MDNLYQEAFKHITIEEVFKPLENTQVDYLQNYGNIGDCLIYASAKQLFEKFNIQHSITMGIQAKRNNVLLVAGGGNLVPYYNSLLPAIYHLQHFYKKVIILPHTINGNRVKKVFSGLGNHVTVLCREKQSYTFLNSFMPSPENLFLCKDLAFNYNFNNYKADGDGVLNAFRIDSEETDINIPQGNIDISQELNINTKPYRGNYWELSYWEEYLELFLSTISNHKQINTNRLHVAIAASMMGKKVEFYPNSYYKNQEVYNFSMSGLRNVQWISQ